MEAFKSLELNLTDKEKADYERYGKSWGQAWVDRALDHLRADLWIEQNLDREITERRKPYNCYNVGTDVYSRQDGQALTDDDIATVKFLDHGQMNKFTVSDDKMTITHHWECDSGD